jgi:hypothetical protein
MVTRSIQKKPPIYRGSRGPLFKFAATLGGFCGLVLLASILSRAQDPEAFFRRYEKTIDGGAKLVATLLAVAAGIASYFRFFRGRTLSARANLELSVEVVRRSSGSMIHLISIELVNVGNVAIRPVTPTVVVHYYGSESEGLGERVEWRVEDEHDGIERENCRSSRTNSFHSSEGRPRENSGGALRGYRKVARRDCLARCETDKQSTNSGF